MLRYEWKWDSCYRSKHDFLQYFCLFLYRHVWLWWKKERISHAITLSQLISYVRTIRLTSLLLISMGIKVGMFLFSL